ncbi:MAG: NfeD family protein [Bacteroidales bacterium]|jgi:membrane-bound serine protease (ClpP class)|nr:NfeD family protein [Bacteroidales bacterium]
MRKFLIFSVILASITLNIYADSIPSPVRKPFKSKGVVYVFDIKEEIAPPVRRKTQKALKEAKEKAVDLIIIHMNTYGGMLDAADSIRTLILTSPIPIWVFIDNNAASAGALISIACDSIYMRPGANIGAATVVDQSGKALPDKYQSYMRSMMRSTAEAKGRDPQIAQAMVDPRITIPGIIDSSMVLTFTAKEAEINGYCEGQADNIEEILKRNNLNDYTIIRQNLSGSDKIIGFLINPFFSGILILIIIGGIYFELQTPGIGFPSAAAIIAAVLYFMPLYLEGLAANWEILIFIVGVILVAVEIFAIPGFGIAGVSGIFLMVTGLTLSMVDNIGFEIFTTGINSLVAAFFIVISASFVSLILSFYFTQKLFGNSTIFGHLALDTVESASDGYHTADLVYSNAVGKKGIAFTILRPVGKVNIEDEILDATAISGYIEKGDPVEVVKYENAQVIVRKLKVD